MTTDSTKIRTGRRVNPAIDGPRRETVCFMLSAGERFAVERLALCLNITRSGMLAQMVADFVQAAEQGRKAKEAERRLLAYLAECRQAVKVKGETAANTLQAMKGKVENPQ